MSLAFGFGLITCQRYPGDPRSDQDHADGRWPAAGSGDSKPGQAALA